MRFGQKSHHTPVEITCNFFAVQFQPIYFVWAQIAPQKVLVSGIGEFVCARILMQMLSISTDTVNGATLIYSDSSPL